MTQFNCEPQKITVSEHHRFSNIYASRKKCDAGFQLALLPHDGGEAPARCDASQQKLGVQFAYLVFHWNQQNWFLSPHALGKPPLPHSSCQKRFGGTHTVSNDIQLITRLFCVEIIISAASCQD